VHGTATSAAVHAKHSCPPLRRGARIAPEIHRAILSGLSFGGIGLDQPTIEQVAELLINTLRLRDVGIEKIDPDEALFGSGLGLDSIDALEIALAVSKSYGVTISSEDPNIKQILASLRNLTEYIQDQRKS
jgi:acyl carrier protein